VGRISVHPRRSGQRVQLGFVPVERTDVVRASLIGLAPLLVGSTLILLVGYMVFSIGMVEDAVVASDWRRVAEGLRGMLDAPDTWIWAYVVFAVSNTMLPSQSDRQAWTPVILYVLLAGALAWIAGLGPALTQGLAAPLAVALRWLGLTYAFTLLADLPFALLVSLAEKTLERARGMRVEY
jgi:hypothetical protein